MSVSRAALALRTGVHDHYLWVGSRIREHVKAAVRKGHRLWSRCCSCACEFLDRFTPEQPDRFFSQASGGEFFRVNQSTQSQRVRHVLCAVATRIPQPPAIIVAEAFCWSCLRERSDHVEHSSDNSVICWRNRHSVSSRQQPRIQEEVECINVVVQRLLEVNAIGTNLPPRLAQQ